MNSNQYKALLQYSKSLDLEELKKHFPGREYMNKEQVIPFLKTALESTVSEDHIAALSLYWLYPDKYELKPFFNQLLLAEGHQGHQALAGHLQRELKYPESVYALREILLSGFDFLQYTCSEDAVIAKWVSHALNAIGTPEAIAVLKEFSLSENIQIKDEMRYRLIRGKHLSNIDFPSMDMELGRYADIQGELPLNGRYFIGHESSGNITFYAAFNKHIVSHAVRHQKFGGSFKMERMTWIKPGFLWMMYRSGWATKKNQERILAISIPREHVKTILEQAVLSTYVPENHTSQEEWKTVLKKSDVRIQWDPDHDKDGVKQARKAIQIGLRGEVLKQYNNEYIVEIKDITEFVEAQRIHKMIYNSPHFLIPREKIITFGENFRITGQ